MEYNYFLNDITSSEGILARYSDICRSMKIKGYLSPDMHNLIEIHTGLTNVKVRNRHLKIMNRLGLLNHKLINGDHIYSLDSPGKVLTYFKNYIRNSKRNLFLEEQIIFTHQIITKLKLQILTLLEIIDDDDYKKNNNIIINYFINIMNHNIWDSARVSKGINLWKNDNVVDRKFINIFKCLEMWLKDLDLIMKKEYVLTERGVKLKNLIKNGNYNFNSLITLFLGTRLIPFNIDLDIDIKLFKKEIMSLYNEIKEPTGFADLPALFTIIIIKLGMKNKKLILNTSRDQLLNKLWADGIVTSLSNDDKGQLRYIVLQT